MAEEERDEDMIVADDAGVEEVAANDGEGAEDKEALVEADENVAEAEQDSGSLFWHGVLGGIIAGLVFALAQMVLSVALDQTFFYPLRLYSTLVLGIQALDPASSLVTAALTGIIVHLFLAALYGIIFVYLLALIQQLRAPTGRLVFYGALYGLSLWLLNFLVIAPAMFPQLTIINQLWLGFVAYTFFFGPLLGVYVAEARPGLAVVETT